MKIKIETLFNKKVAVVFFLVGVLCFLIKPFTPESIDKFGLLHEPYFFLIPVGFSFLFLAVLIGVISFVLKNLTKKRSY